VSALRASRLARALGTFALLASLALASALAPRAAGAFPKSGTADEPVAVWPPHPALAALDCARCHAEVAREWAHSAHAHAWTNPHYQAELATLRRPDSCHPCHAPQPLSERALGAAPLVRGERDEPRAHGVSCASCHAGPDGAWLGPTGTPTSAHATLRSERLLAPGVDELCASCHATTIGPVIALASDFRDGGPRAAGASCVGCHIPERAHSIEPEDVSAASSASAPARLVLSHALRGPSDADFLRSAFELGVRAQRPGALELELHNRAGHRVPGLVGRVLSFELHALAADGTRLASTRAELTARDPLPVAARLELALAWPGAQAASALECVAWHVAREGEPPRAFWRERIELSP